MPRVLVTGATGYIGRHLVRSLLRRGLEVRCLVRSLDKGAELARRGAELVLGSILDPAAVRTAVQGCEVTYHLAGLTCALTAAELYDVNAYGTWLVARACAQRTSPPLLLVVSSLAAAGTAIAGRPRRESDRPRPISHYGRSKRAGERAAITWADRLPLSIVRPGIVFGPGNRELLPVFRSIHRFRIHAVPGYTPRRISLIHHDDLILLIDRIVQKGGRVEKTIDGPAGCDESPGIYFATTAPWPTYASFGRLIARALGHPDPLLMHLAEPVAWLAAGVNQSLSWYRRTADNFNVDKIREALAGDWIATSARAHQQLNFRPSWSLAQGLRETAQWYLEHGWL